MSTLTPEVRSHRARVASLSRSRQSDDPDLQRARRDLRAAAAASYIERVLAEAPPLTDEQRRRLAGLLSGGVAR